MPSVRTGPLVGLIVQAVVLAALAATVGLGYAGWLAGLIWGAGICVALVHGMRRLGMHRLGAANRVTLARATLVGGATALIVDSFAGPTSVNVLVTLTTVALALDWVDGQVARRGGTVTALGASFDMEVDAFLVLMLCVYVADPVGAWVLAIGAMRYALLVATWFVPWTRGPVPPRYWRKVVAATQGIVLVVAVADVLPQPVAAAALAVALALLVESFGRDVVWLWQQRPAGARVGRFEPEAATAAVD